MYNGGLERARGEGVIVSVLLITQIKKHVKNIGIFLANDVGKIVGLFSGGRYAHAANITSDLISLCAAWPI